MIGLKKNLYKILPKGQFIRNVGILMGGTVGAQILLVLASPFLTRLYSPEDFGLFAIYSGLVGSFSVIASLRYELAIPLPEKKSDAVNVLFLSIVLVLGISLLSAITIKIFGNDIVSLLNSQKLVDYLWLLPIGVFMSSLHKAFKYWAIRTERFSVIAKIYVYQSITIISVQIIGHEQGGIALVIGLIFGHLVTTSILIKDTIGRGDLRYVRFRSVKKVAKRYRQFPLFSTWSGVFNTVGQQLPPLMFSSFFGVSAAGFYSLAHRVLVMPMSIIGQSVANVFFPSATEAARNGQLRTLVHKIHNKLALIAMPPLMAIVISGPEIFTFVFGEQWYQSGEFARWIAPWLYVVFVTSPLSNLVSVLEKQKQGMFFQTILLIVRVVAIIFGAIENNLLLGVILFSLGSMLCWMGFLIWIIIISGNTLIYLVKISFYSIVISLFCTAPLWFSKLLADYFFIVFLITGVFISMHYFRLFKRHSINE